LAEETLQDAAINSKHDKAYIMETEGHIAVIDYDKYR
jgi:cGMP-dependent protein kinase